MKKVVTIGVSGFASVHFRDLKRQHSYGNISIVAATVINQEEELERCAWLTEHGCQLFTDFQEMLAEYRNRADVCIIPTGIHWHLPMTEAALKAGMNVLLEKPAAATIQEVLYMKQLELEAEKRVYTGYQHMYSDQVWRAKADILADKIGKIRVLKSCGIWPRSAAYFNRNDWAGKLRNQDRWILDSPFNNAFAHWLNLLCFLSGPSLVESASPKEIQAELYRANDIESADTACMRILTDTGITLLLYLTHASTKKVEPSLEVLGEHGQITIQEFPPQKKRNDVDYYIIAKEKENELRDQMYETILERSQSIGCSLENASKQTICTNGAHESSPINPIPIECLKKVATADDYFVYINDIDEIIRDAHKKEQLFSELDTVSWAKPGSKVSLSDYSSFTDLCEANPTLKSKSLRVY